MPRCQKQSRLHDASEGGQGMSVKDRLKHKRCVPRRGQANVSFDPERKYFTVSLSSEFVPIHVQLRSEMATFPRSTAIHQHSLKR